MIRYAVSMSSIGPDLKEEWISAFQNARLKNVEVIVRSFLDTAEHAQANLELFRRMLNEKVIRIESSDKSRLAIPFFNLEETFCDWVYNKFFGPYGDYRFRRGDYCLPMYFLHWFVARVRWFREYMYGKYGYKRQHVTVEKGTLEGEREERVYYLVYKKIYADRFPTDCYSGFFARRTALAEIGIEEMPEYTDLYVSMDEWAQQKSYLIRDMTKNLVEGQKVGKGEKRPEKKSESSSRGFFVVR